MLTPGPVAGTVPVRMPSASACRSASASASSDEAPLLLQPAQCALQFGDLDVQVVLAALQSVQDLHEIVRSGGRQGVAGRRPLHLQHHGEPQQRAEQRDHDPVGQRGSRPFRGPGAVGASSTIVRP